MLSLLKYLWLSLFLGPGSGASMAEQDVASGSLHGKKQLPGQCAISVFWGFFLFFRQFMRKVMVGQGCEMGKKQIWGGMV